MRSSNMKGELSFLKAALITIVTVITLSAIADSANACDSSHGGYVMFGVAKELSTEKKLGSERGMYGAGYEFSNGIHLEIGHSSFIGAEDGVSTRGDRQFEIETDEDSIRLYHRAYFD